MVTKTFILTQFCFVPRDCTTNSVNSPTVQIIPKATNLLYGKCASDSWWLDLHLVGQCQDQEETSRNAGEGTHFV